MPQLSDHFAIFLKLFT